MDVLKEEERNVDYLKSKIKLKSMEEKNSNETKNEENNIKSNAFTTDTRKCYRCGKPGHLYKDCYQQNSTDQRGRGGYNRSRSRDRGFYQRGNYRGNYRGVANTSSSHHGRQSEQAISGNTFITEINASEVGNNFKLGKNQVSWILNSDYTDHIVNDDRLFNEYVVLKEPTDVKLGDGRILKATKLDKIITDFELFKNK